MTLEEFTVVSTMFSMVFTSFSMGFPMFSMGFSPSFPPPFPRQPGTTWRLGGSEAADSAVRLLRQAAHEKGRGKAAERLGPRRLSRGGWMVDDDGWMMLYWLVVTGCHEFYFPINIGLRLSSQLTNSYFSEGFTNHQPVDGWKNLRRDNGIHPTII